MKAETDVTVVVTGVGADNDVTGSQFSARMLFPFCCSSSDGEMRIGLWLEMTTFFCRLLLRTGILVVSFRRIRSKRDDDSDMQSSLC